MEWVATGSTREWVAAEPFRAHLRHLMAAGSLSAEDIAALAGLSASCVRHLVDGRDGRPIRRISPPTARRLLQLSTSRIESLSRVLVPAGLARLHLRRLRRWGWSDHRIAERLDCSIDEVTELAAGARECRQLLVVRLTAAARAEDGERSRSATLHRIAG